MLNMYLYFCKILTSDFQSLTKGIFLTTLSPRRVVGTTAKGYWSGKFYPLFVLTFLLSAPIFSLPKLTFNKILSYIYYNYIILSRARGSAEIFSCKKAERKRDRQFCCIFSVNVDFTTAYSCLFIKIKHFTANEFVPNRTILPYHDYSIF